MITDREIYHPAIEIPAVEALRYLGMARKAREPRESIRLMFEEELRAAKRLIEPVGVLARCPQGLPGSAVYGPDSPIALGVCTIGSALDRRVTQLFAEGDGARGVILDAIGSAAVEEVAERLDAIVCELASGEGLYAGVRRSPGYGKWDITEQRLIFGALQPVESGVELNESCMMSPQKSVSFAVALDADAARRHRRSRCEQCDLETCAYRDPDDPDPHHHE